MSAPLTDAQIRVMREIAIEQAGYEFAKGSTIPKKDRRRISGHDLLLAFDELVDLRQRVKVLAAAAHGTAALLAFKVELETQGWLVDLALGVESITMTASRPKE